MDGVPVGLRLFASISINNQYVLTHPASFRRQAEYRRECDSMKKKIMASLMASIMVVVALAAFVAPA